MTKTKTDGSESHPGKGCSPDCAEYGCSWWTGFDPDIYEQRKAAERGERV